MRPYSYPWEDGVAPSDDWSSLVLTRVYPEQSVGAGDPIGYVFVIEPARCDPKYKMPGGHKKPGESPLQTAMRELNGETGLQVPERYFTYIGSLWRQRPSPHWSILFTANIAENDVAWTNDHQDENEGEVPKFLTVAEFAKVVEENGFLFPHLQRLRQARLISGV